MVERAISRKNHRTETMGYEFYYFGSASTRLTLLPQDFGVILQTPEQLAEARHEVAWHHEEARHGTMRRQRNDEALKR